MQISCSENHRSRETMLDSRKLITTVTSHGLIEKSTHFIKTFLEELKRTTRLLKQLVSQWGYLWFPGFQILSLLSRTISATKCPITQPTTPCGYLLNQWRLPHLQSTHGCIVCETTSSMKHYHAHFDFLKDYI